MCHAVCHALRGMHIRVLMPRHAWLSGRDRRAQAQADSQAAQQREIFYCSALQELTLFKSRTSAALLQARRARARAGVPGAQAD